MQTRNKANASHHMSAVPASILLVIRIRVDVTKSKLLSSMHSKISTPHCNTGTDCLKSVLICILFIPKDAQRLLFVYIGGTHTIGQYGREGFNDDILTIVPQRNRIWKLYQFKNLEDFTQALLLTHANVHHHDVENPVAIIIGMRKQNESW